MSIYKMTNTEWMNVKQTFRERLALRQAKIAKAQSIGMPKKKPGKKK